MVTQIYVDRAITVILGLRLGNLGAVQYVLVAYCLTRTSLIRHLSLRNLGRLGPVLTGSASSCSWSSTTICTPMHQRIHMNHTPIWLDMYTLVQLRVCIQ